MLIFDSLSGYEDKCLKYSKIAGILNCSKSRDYLNFKGDFSIFDSCNVVVFKTEAEIDKTLNRNRMALWFESKETVDSLASNVKTFFTDYRNLELVRELKTLYPNNLFFLHHVPFSKTNIHAEGFNLILDIQIWDLCSVIDLFVMQLKTDREDGLYSTIVANQQGTALGLCYSSKESIIHSVSKSSGVYFSRSRGLWFKGASSGCTQKLIKIDIDCDGDTLRFTVDQIGSGFCHLGTKTCFGDDTGILNLYTTIEERFKSAPDESYTKRLFNDKELLHSKLREETDELINAKDKENAAWELADLLYFAFTKAISMGVTLSDIENNLASKALKVTRRPGNAKSKYLEPKNYDSIKIIKYSTLDIEQASCLLLRPIINNKEIMERVRPIMSEVRARGDSALKELTLKYDKVLLNEVSLKSPFPAHLRELPVDIKNAIDLAFNNIEKFHKAQIEKDDLIVETMPGVICRRMSRPIQNVGLYVPGGTAVLPSTALMLGIPAMVAGCKEIIIATPPRLDGSISPEIVYVAHKIGSSMILKAGGAQAVASLAYGTESIPKVDKICGPGNQYVTAAKMIAQVKQKHNHRPT